MEDPKTIAELTDIIKRQQEEIAKKDEELRWVRADRAGLNDILE